MSPDEEMRRGRPLPYETAGAVDEAWDARAGGRPVSAVRTLKRLVRAAARSKARTRRVKEAGDGD